MDFSHMVPAGRRLKLGTPLLICIDTGFDGTEEAFRGKSDVSQENRQIGSSRRSSRRSRPARN